MRLGKIESSEKESFSATSDDVDDLSAFKQSGANAVDDYSHENVLQRRLMTYMCSPAIPLDRRIWQEHIFPLSGLPGYKSGTPVSFGIPPRLEMMENSLGSVPFYVVDKISVVFGDALLFECKRPGMIAHSPRIRWLKPVHLAQTTHLSTQVFKPADLWYLGQAALLDGAEEMKAKSENGLVAALAFGPVLECFKTRAPHVLTEPDAEGYLPIHWAATFDNVLAMEHILEVDPKALSRPCGSGGYIASFFAAWHGSVRALRFIFSMEDKSLLGSFLGNAAIWAVMGSRPESLTVIAELMPELFKWVSPTARRTILHLAVQTNNFEMTRILATHCRDSMFLRDATGLAPAHVAAYCNTWEAISALIDVDPHCILVESRGRHEGWNAAHFAAFFHSPQALRMLAHRCPKLMTRPFSGDILPAHCLRSRDCLQIGMELFPSLLFQPVQGRSSLISACIHGYTPWIEFFASRHAEQLLVPDAESGLYPAHILVSQGYHRCLEVLGYMCREALMVACEDGMTCAHLAAQYGFWKCLNVVRQHSPALLLVENLKGQLPLDFAELMNRRSCVRLLRDFSSVPSQWSSARGGVKRRRHGARH